MAPKALAPGVRFHPTDVELVKYYLQKKVTGKRIRFDVISEVDVYKFSPSELPDKSQLKSTDLEWFFFCPRERKYGNGARMNRATENGYWKTTGRDRLINFNDKVVGMIKTLIYHEGRAPHGSRTDWVMHEYRLKDDDLAKSGTNQDAYVICKIFLKSGPGPRPTQHLFKEDDWSDDDDDDTPPHMCASADLPLLSATNMNYPGCSPVSFLCDPDNISTDGSVEERYLKSSKVFKKGDSDTISVLELQNSHNKLPSMVTVQEVSELTQVSKSHVCGTQNECKRHLPCQKGMHVNTSLLYEGLPHNTIFLDGEFHEGTCMLPSRSHGAEVGLSDNINHGGFVQSAPLDWHDLYNDFNSFYDLGVQSGHAESFIELDDLTNPLDNEFQWSHLIPSDGLLNEVDRHGIEVPPPLSVDDYRDRICSDAPAESQLVAGPSLGFCSCIHTPQKDVADEIGNRLFPCNENWRHWEG